MIKTEKGNATVKGSCTEIMADLSVIVHELYFNVFADMEKEEVKKRILFSIERGFKTPEELEEDNQKMIGELLSRLGETMKKEGEE